LTLELRNRMGASTQIGGADPPVGCSFVRIPRARVRADPELNRGSAPPPAGSVVPGMSSKAQLNRPWGGPPGLPPRFQYLHQYETKILNPPNGFVSHFYFCIRKGTQPPTRVITTTLVNRCVCLHPTYRIALYRARGRVFALKGRRTTGAQALNSEAYHRTFNCDSHNCQCRCRFQETS
jgi:hypothetical protein